MKAESDPITTDESLLRLVWKDYYKPADALPVRPVAFAPRPNETDGISVFRSACLIVPDAALDVIAAGKRDKYAIVLLPVAELQALGLSVVPAVIESVPGHAVIPELNIVRAESEAVEVEALKMALARIGSRHIIRTPIA